jgi:hypothetical protein
MSYSIRGVSSHRDANNRLVLVIGHGDFHQGPRPSSNRNGSINRMDQRNGHPILSHAGHNQDHYTMALPIP